MSGRTLPRELLSPPGLDPARIGRLMRDAVDRLDLDLSGLTVLTEAATGAYGVTAPLAALAGASKVYAVGRSSRYGTSEEAAAWTLELARQVAVEDRIETCTAVPDDLSRVDIVTNSGHLRPIGSAMVAKLHAGAVIALMFEAWELRDGDIAVPECRARGIRIAGVNERHPAVDVFSYLGPLACAELHRAGYPVYGNRIAVLCDNDFGPYILRSLKGLGADASIFAAPEEMPAAAWDCVVVALTPHREPRIGAVAAAILAARAPGALIAQVWGDLDRPALSSHGLRVVPAVAPKAGHMAVLLSDIGPEPIVRLQSGGLRAAEIVFRNAADPGALAQLVQLERAS